MLQFLLPNQNNNYRPRIFTYRGVGILCAALLVVQVVLTLHIQVLNSSMLSAVLPGAVVALTNKDRSAFDAQPLQRDSLLDAAAQLKAQHMAKNGYFSHVDPQGRSPWYWLDVVGYEYKRAGENLAIHFSDSNDVTRAWRDSPAHRANMLKKQFTRVGVATARGTYEGHPTTFIVQFFAQPLTDKQYAYVDTQPRSMLAAAGATVTASPKTMFVWFIILSIVFTLVLLLYVIMTQQDISGVEIVASGSLCLLVLLAFLFVNTRNTTQVPDVVENQDIATVEVR